MAELMKERVCVYYDERMMGRVEERRSVEGESRVSAILLNT